MRQLEAESPALRVQASDASPKLQREPKVEETSGTRPQTQIHTAPEAETAAEMEQLFAWSRARHEFEQQRNEVMEQMAVINEKLDKFAEAHPTIAKYSDKIIESIGTLAMGIALFAGPEVTAATVLTNGATLLTYGKLFDVLIDGGSEKFIDYCALQGRTEAESIRYGTAAAGIVNKLLMVSVVKGGLKVVGSKKSSTHKMSSTEASARAKEVYRAKVTDENTISAEVSKGISSILTENPQVKDFILTPYRGPGGGHHIHMKSAYKSHPLYDLNEALCLSNEEMMRLGINHLKVTTEQRRLCVQLNQSGKVLTREEMNMISIQALMAGGANEQLARNIVAKSLLDLKNKGVRSPTDQPFMRNKK